jgi:hypothetical protein
MRPPLRPIAPKASCSTAWNPSGRNLRASHLADNLVRRPLIGNTHQGVDSTELPTDPFAGDDSGLAQSMCDGLLLWDSLRSYRDVPGFFDALDALEADDLRKVVLAVRALASENARLVNP